MGRFMDQYQSSLVEGQHRVGWDRWVVGEEPGAKIGPALDAADIRFCLPCTLAAASSQGITHVDDRTPAQSLHNAFETTAYPIEIDGIEGIEFG